VCVCVNLIDLLLLPYHTISYHIVISYHHIITIKDIEDARHTLENKTCTHVAVGRASLNAYNSLSACRAETRAHATMSRGP
jgi:hypothetical protein